MARRMAAIRLPEDVTREARVVAPVPTTAIRLRERGYNQAEVLARVFARETGRTVICTLERSAVARAARSPCNPLLAWLTWRVLSGRSPGRTDDIAGEHLLLVDDVLTTGATVTACTEALVDAGARCVSVITFARAMGRLQAGVDNRLLNRN
jgi:predicted amidophosphoribosyltransferase